MPSIAVEKRLDLELPMPEIWRPTLKKISDALVLGTSNISDFAEEIIPIDDGIAEINRQNIESYPDEIGELTEISWTSSIYIWKGSYWQSLIDLVTTSGEISDLVLHCKVFENEASYRFEPYMIYVP